MLLATALQLFAAVFSVAILLRSAPTDAAQTVPYKVNFQGRLTDNNGDALTDGLYNIKFRLWTALSGGSNVWEEDRVITGTDNRVQITGGLFNIQFGDLTAMSPSLFNTGAGTLYLEVELPTPATATCATNGCASFTEGAMTPRQPLASSPYAFNSDTLDGLDSAQFGRTDAANTFTGATQLFKNSGDSSTSFQIQPATTSTPIFDADTQHARIGVNTAAPGYALDVVGSINTDTSLKVAGADVCTSAGCTPAPGSGYYIQNQAGAAQSANFDITSTATTSPTGTVEALSGQTADLLQFQDSSGVYLAGVQSDGVLNLGPVAGTAQVLGASSFGDKLALYTSPVFGRYGFGVQSNTLVANVGTGGSFALRVDPGAGQASSGSNVFSVSASGGVVAAGSYQGTTASLTATSSLTLGAGGSAKGQILFKSDTTTNNTTLQPGSPSAAPITLTLPSATTSAGDCLKDSTGAGVLAFSSCTAGVDLQTVYNNSSGTPATITTSSSAKGLLIKSGTGNNSATAFQIQEAGGIPLLTADTEATTDPLRVKIGDTSTTASPVLLVLDYEDTDPAGANGSMYFNTTTNKFRCYQDTGWVDCITDSTAKVFDAYDNTGGTSLGAGATVALDTTRKNSDTSVFNLSGNTLTINSTGTFIFQYRVSATNASTQSTMRIWLERNTGSGFTELTGSRAYGYSRDTSATGTGFLILDVTSGDQFRLRGATQTGNFTTTAAGSGLEVFAATAGGIAGSGGGGGGANTALSNLSSTSINQSLDADTNNTRDLGTSGDTWRDGYFGTSLQSPVFTGPGAVTLSSGGSSDLTLDSASGTIALASDDTGLQHTAAGTYSIDLTDSAATTLSVTNSGAGVASLSVEGGINIGSGQLYKINGAQIGTANLVDGGSITMQGNTFNGVSQLVQTTGSGALPALSGANLTSLNPSSLTTGTGAVTLQSAAAGALTITSGSGTIGLGSGTLQRAAAGAFTLDLNSSSATSLSVTNAGAGVAGLSVEGGLTIGSGQVVTVGAAPGTSPTCSGGQFLQDQTVSGGIVTGGTCAAAGGNTDLQGAYDNNTSATITTSSATKDVVIKSGSGFNSATTLQVIPDGTSTATLTVDTLDNRVGIGTNSPAQALDVAGSINASGDYYMGGTAGISRTCSGGNVLQNAVVAGGIVTGGTCAAGGGGGGGSSQIGALVAQVYDSAGGTDVNTATPTAIPWGAETRVDTGYTHSITTNKSRVTLDNAGWYRITYSITAQDQGANPNNSLCEVRLNGATVNAPSSSYSYASDSTNAAFATNTSSVIISAAASDYYEVVCSKAGATGSALTVAGKSWTLVEKLDGASPFTTNSGIITQTNATDRLQLNIGETGDTGLEIQGIASQTANFMEVRAAAGATNPILAIDAGGGLQFGAGGSNALDTTLYRSGTSTLKTDGQFQVGTLAAASGTAVCIDGSGTLASCSTGSAGLQGAYNASTDPEITLSSGVGALSIRDATSALTGNLLEVQNHGGTVNYLAVTSTGLSTSGNVSIGAGQKYYIGGTQIATSDLLDGATVTKQGNSFNGVSQLVETDGSGALPALSGANVTSLNPTSLATGSGAVSLASGGSSPLTLTSANGVIALGSDILQRASSSLAFDVLNASANSTLTVTNSDGTHVANLSVEGSVTSVGLNAGSGAVTTSGNLSTTGSGTITSAGAISGPTSGTINGLSINAGALSNVGNITGAAAVTLASGGSSALTLTSASGTVVLGSGTVQRAASGLTIDVNNGASASTLTVTNSGAGAASLTVEGGITIGSGQAITVGATAGATTSCSGGQYLQNQTVAGGITTGGTCTAIATGLSSRSFVDTTADAIVAANNTTSYWDTATENNNTFPNITPSATTKSVYGIVTIDMAGTGSQDTTPVVRIERRTGGTSPTCNDTTNNTVVDSVAAFTTNSGDLNTASGTFVDNGATTSKMVYNACSDTNTGATTGSITKIRVTLFEVDNSNADLAELYPTNDATLHMGELITMDPSITNGVKRTTTAYDRAVVGVISTSPALLIGGKGDEGVTAVPVALSGRVPVLVSDEGGSIQPGDPLTSSSTPGVAMKATQAGYVIGRSMQAFAGPGQGVVMGFVGTHYYDPANPNASASPVAADANGNIVTTIAQACKSIWKNTTGAAVAWVSDTGDAFFASIQASLGNFSKLVTGNLVLEKQAKLSGSSVIGAGQGEIFIDSPNIAADSVVNLTPSTKSDGYTLYIKEKRPGQGFVVGVNQVGASPAGAPIPPGPINFDWLVVNQE